MTTDEVASKIAAWFACYPGERLTRDEMEAVAKLAHALLRREPKQ